MKFGNIDLQGLGELRNANIQNLASAPTTNLKKGRFYFNTTDNTLYVYDGTQWIDALSQGDYTFQNGVELVSGTRNVQLNIASGANAGNVTLTADSNGLAASAPAASTSTAGLIEIATDAEASTGTSETLAVNPKQLKTGLDNKVDKLSTAPTAGTYTKVTINSDGLVSNGESLQASDIPDLSLSKITDVTATAAEVNVLDGITASTAELNILDGVTVNASDINSVTSKIELTDLSIDSNSTDYLNYDNTTGEFSANVDTTVTASSTNLVTSGAVDTAINNAIIGGVKYIGTWTATSQTDYSSITLPVKMGYLYLVEGSATITAGGKTIEWNTGDYLIVNANVASGGTLTDVSKIDNTEASDIVRLNATQTITNKTIDADDNTISDLTTSNFKSGTVVTSVGATGSDSAIPTEKAVRDAIKALSYSAQNPALTQSGGVCTWTVTHNLGSSDVDVSVYEVATGERVMYDYAITSSSVVTVKILSASNISADTYKVVVQG